MALLSYLVLLLVAHSVSIVPKERHSLYHTALASPSQYGNWEYRFVVLLDGIAFYCYGEGRTCIAWSLKTRLTNVTAILNTDFQMSRYLLQAVPSYDSDDTGRMSDDHVEKRPGCWMQEFCPCEGFFDNCPDSYSELRFGCEVERSSSGDMTLLNTTADYRHNGKTILHFSFHEDQWEVTHKQFLPVKTRWDRLLHVKQIIKNYVQQKCMNRLMTYLRFYEENEEKKKEQNDVFNVIKDANVTKNKKSDAIPKDKDKEGNWEIGENWLSVIIICIIIVCVVMVLIVILFMILRRKFARRTVEAAYREDLNEQQSQILPRTIPLVVLKSEDQDGGDSVHTPMLESKDHDGGDAEEPKKRFSNPLKNLPPVLAEAENDDDDDGQNLSQDRPTQTAGLIAAGERHSLYHIYTVHYSLSQNSSNITEFTAAVLFDGEQVDYSSDSNDRVSEQMEESWRNRATMRKEHQTVLNEFDGFIHLLELSSRDDHHFIKRRGCEVERSSSGGVTLLNTTDEYTHNGKVVLYFDVHNYQWMVLDNEFLPVKVMWDNEPHRNQMTKDYLQQRCMDRLLSYLGDYDGDSNEMPRPPDVYDYDYVDYSGYYSLDSFPDVPPVRLVLSTKMFSLTMIIIIVLVVIFALLRRRTVTTTKCSLINGVIDQVLLSFKKRIRKEKAAEPPGIEASREELKAEDEDDDGKNLDRWSQNEGLTPAGGDGDGDDGGGQYHNKNRQPQTAGLD
ncbi:uncharacterized protein LOC108414206 isoform X2 [Pygocentrus nattereri]|uniref:uncharacterized protein LOC108414206 isoform X2 n=1 Tax=Pygocentrus nattereri TaxID=42514 RepID=UPI0018916556|nr:uncharacterized protein LOC108414206 isoform X2 [Pygocentrus nattereri]